MAKYRADKACFIDSCYREPGEIFEYLGTKPEPWMTLIEDVPELQEPAKTPSAKEEKAKAKSSRASDQKVI